MRYTQIKPTPTRLTQAGYWSVFFHGLVLHLAIKVHQAPIKSFTSETRYSVWRSIPAYVLLQRNCRDPQMWTNAVSWHHKGFNGVLLQDSYNLCICCINVRTYDCMFVQILGKYWSFCSSASLEQGETGATLLESIRVAHLKDLVFRSWAISALNPNNTMTGCVHLACYGSLCQTQNRMEKHGKDST